MDLKLWIIQEFRLSFGNGNQSQISSQLYLDFLKYDIKPTPQDFEKWRDDFRTKLNKFTL